MALKRSAVARDKLYMALMRLDMSVCFSWLSTICIRSCLSLRALLASESYWGRSLLCEACFSIEAVYILGLCEFGWRLIIA